MRRLHRRHPADLDGAAPGATPGATAGATAAADEPVPFDPHDLAGLLTAPPWLRDLGRSSWLAVGLLLFIVAMVWIAALTQTIVAPVITAAVVASVASPLVQWIDDRGPSRGIAAALVFLGFIIVGALVVWMILRGVGTETSSISGELSSGKDKIAGWLNDLGVDHATTDTAKSDASNAVSSIVPALLNGLGAGLKKLSSLAFFLSLTALSLFFLLKDGPLIRTFAERHMRVQPAAAHKITGRVLESLRGYFLGVTIVAGFNAVVVGLGALILGVPLVGTIVILTFLGAYIPYLGAWTAGAFAVLIALGGAGTNAAIGMIVIQLLANGVLQQMVQPIAYGSALGIHPLAVLIVTIAGGALFGAVGLILAAPLTAAVTKIAADLAAGTPKAAPGAPEPVAAAPTEPEPEPAPAA
jgi:predicted PurR-regulated permease PerM